MFTSPQVNVYSQDVARAVGFYRALGFAETFRTPREGTPIHVELVLDGLLATVVTPMVRTVTTDGGRQISLPALVPLSPAEIGLKLTLGTDALLQALDRAAVNEVLDPGRPSTV